MFYQKWNKTIWDHGWISPVENVFYLITNQFPKIAIIYNGYNLGETKKGNNKLF